MIKYEFSNRLQIDLDPKVFGSSYPRGRASFRADCLIYPVRSTSRREYIVRKVDGLFENKALGLSHEKFIVIVGHRSRTPHDLL